MFTLGKKMEHIKQELAANTDLSGKKVVFIDEFGNAIGGDIQAYHAVLNERSGKMGRIMSGIRGFKNNVADKLINMGVDGQTAILNPGLLSNDRAEASIKGYITLIVGAVVIVKLAASILPGAYSDWSYATNNASGAMYNATTADKATWNTGSSMIAIFGFLVIVGLALRAL